MRALKEHRSIRGWGTFLRTFVKLLIHQVYSIESSAGAAARLLPG